MCQIMFSKVLAYYVVGILSVSLTVLYKKKKKKEF